ncbi:hypothetical protein [Shouchella clausii]|uniref:hypothetical protein n=1 Tax=Shouchella clausii TaxID=79880 RepID=UPI0031843568
MLDLNAPIVPWKGMGNIELYSHLKDFYEYINKSRPKILNLDWFNTSQGFFF